MTALQRLQEKSQWVAWKYKERRGKTTKPPIDPHTGRMAHVTNSATWGTFAQAWARKESDELPGVGFVLTPDDNLTGADLDHVRDPATGELKQWAADIVALAETYCEISPSGEGLRLFWEGRIDETVKNDAQSVELYSDNRYLTFTGNRIESCPDAINPAPRTKEALLARAATVHTNGHRPPPPDDYSRLNDTALANLGEWVPPLFGNLARPAARGGYRVSSAALGRDLEEDLSITSQGIVDFGVADQGDARQGKRTPVGLIMEHKHWTFDEAVTFLCEKLDYPRPAPLLSPNTPLKSARSLMHARFTTEDSLPILWFHKGIFWIWRDGYYLRLEDPKTLEHTAWKFLDLANKRTDAGVKPYNPKRRDVGELVAALGSVCALDPFITTPCWLHDRDMPPAMEFLSCANGLLHVPTGELYPPTPDLFNVSASRVTFNPEAPTPDAWLAFLDQVLCDAQAIETLQDWFGYTLTPDTSQQKILFCIGPRRSGKGTIARIQEALLGNDSVAGPTMSALGETFGLEPLITKPLAIVADARIGGRTDKSAVVERLLSISGEDQLTVNRKFLSAWTGRLPTRFEILTNELPSLAEGSGALVGRLLMLVFQQSFYGREDPKLFSKLASELPGILNWSIDGYRRLRDRGHFVQPGNATEQLEQIETLGAPIKAFLRDRCVVGPLHEVSIDALFDRWKSWNEANGSGNHIGTKDWFSRNLFAAVPGLTIVRRGAAGSQGRFYRGLGVAGGASSDRVEEEIPF